MGGLGGEGALQARAGTVLMQVHARTLGFGSDDGLSLTMVMCSILDGQLAQYILRRPRPITILTSRTNA